MGADFRAYSVIGVEFDSNILEDDEHLGEFDVFHATDRVISVAGVGVVTGSSNGGDPNKFKSLDDVNVDEIKEKLKSILEPVGQWDESKFGLYAILHCSY